MPKNCHQEWMDEQDLHRIFAALDGSARLVGGCVRDACIGGFVKDIDIATPYLPDQIIKLLQKEKIKVIPTGIKHGTVTAVVNNKNYEITTLRSDVACDGRHAKVEFTDSWQLDAARRDFTINAMSCDLLGNLYDYFGGYDDLIRGCVRFVGDANSRCQEDILRILRFFRFNAYYGKHIDEKGLAACIKYKDQISNLSGERIQSETLKLFGSGNAGKILGVMQENGICDKIFPARIDTSLVKKLGLAEPLLKLAATILAYSKEQLDNLAKRWKMSNKHKNYLIVMLENKENIILDNIPKRHAFIRKYGKEIASDLAILQAEILDYGDISSIINEINNWEIPAFPISGKDLAKIGIPPGKQMGRLLKSAESLWEEGGYKADKDQLMDFVMKSC